MWIRIRDTHTGYEVRLVSCDGMVWGVENGWEMEEGG